MDKRFRHGFGKLPNGRLPRLYHTWADMIQRTSNPNNYCYEYYGGRGISVCKEWLVASVFIKWALDNDYKEGLTIDRIDNNGNYEPDNCRFVTRQENNLNRRKRKHFGIYPIKKKFFISLTRNNKSYHGGTASTIEEAIILRDNLWNKLLIPLK